jgi:hypothetical protein
LLAIEEDKWIFLGINRDVSFIHGFIFQMILIFHLTAHLDMANRPGVSAVFAMCHYPQSNKQ